MVTVYIWEPTTSIDMDYTNHNLINTPYDPISKGNQTDKFARQFSRSVGHASLHIYNDNYGYDIYFSLYPKSNKEIKIITQYNNPFTSQFCVDYQADFNEFGSHASHRIHLKNLDERKMAEHVNVVNQKYKQYILLKKNCSSLVIELLKIGSSNLSPSMFKNVGNFFKNTAVVVETLAFFMEAMGGLKDINYLPPSSRSNIYHSSLSSSKNTLTLPTITRFRPMLSIEKLIEICGYDTPLFAYNYAEFLKAETE